MVQSFKNHTKACRRSKLSIQQRIENYLLTYRSTKHPTTGKTPASLFLGREHRTRLSLLRPMAEKRRDSQAKQKATNDVHSKFRKFYPVDRTLVKDLSKANIWWPGTVAKRSGPKSYFVVLDDGRVWKRHVGHVRRESMERTETKQSRESQNKPLDVPLAFPFSVSVPNPSQAPSASPSNVRREMESGQEQAQGEAPSVTVEEAPPGVTQPLTPRPLLRRSATVRKAPDRLIETVWSSV